MFADVTISPSILSADFMNLGRDIRTIEEGGAGMVHVDVMDGHFVPNLTIGVPVVKQLRAITDLPLDVHLMISNPLDQLDWYLDAGADIVTMHLESFDEAEAVRGALTHVREAGAKAALAIKPATDVEELGRFLDLLDMALVMSVNPGFSGQSFMEGSDAKVARLVEMCREANVAPIIQCDGGIGEATVGQMAAAGADCFVCGNAVMKADDPKAAIASISRLAEAARDEALREG